MLQEKKEVNASSTKENIEMTSDPFIVSLSVIVIVVDVVVVVNVVVVIEASRGSSKNVHYLYSYLIFI